MPSLRFGRFRTPIGEMLLAASDDGLVAASRTDDDAAFLRRLVRRFPGGEILAEPDPLRSIADWLTAYLAGQRPDLPAVDLTGLSAFDAAVYEAVRAVPYGTTATYGEIAAAVGAPRAARAVGGALGRCPLFPAVPCHRVVRAVDGISGWGGDLRLKRRLLALEAGVAPAWPR